jgi:hypothetical protein
MPRQFDLFGPRPSLDRWFSLPTECRSTLIGLYARAAARVLRQHQLRGDNQACPDALWETLWAAERRRSHPRLYQFQLIPRRRLGSTFPASARRSLMR